VAARKIPQWYRDEAARRIREARKDKTNYWVRLPQFVRFCVRTGLFPQLVEEPFWSDVLDILRGNRSHKHWLVPREHTKTSFLKALASYLLCDAPPELGGARCRINFAGESKEFAKRNTRALKRILETNSFIIQKYGQMKPSKDLLAELREIYEKAGKEFSRPEWTVTALRTARCVRAEIESGNAWEEPSAFATGLDVATTGMHYEVLFFDDPVTEKSAKSQIRKAKAYSTFVDFGSQLLATGLCIVVGTRHAIDDIHHTLLNEHAGEFQVVCRNCWGDDSTDLWIDDFNLDDATGEISFNFDPDQVNVLWHGFGQIEKDVVNGPLPPRERKREALRCLYRKMLRLRSRTKWAHQMLNVAIASEDRLFTEEMFRAFHTTSSKHHRYVFTDSATGSDSRSSYRVVAVVELDPDDNAYVRDLQYGYWAPEEYMTRALDAYTTWGARSMGMEKVAWQDAFKTVLELLCRMRGVPKPRITTIAGRSLISKVERIEGLEPRLKAGKLLFEPGFKERTDVNGRTVWDETVRQFCSVTESGQMGALKIDIPDALSDIDALDNEGRRLFKPPRKPRVENRISQDRLRADAVMEPLRKRIAASRQQAVVGARDPFRQGHQRRDIFGD
jgi:hypothetical protein